MRFTKILILGILALLTSMPVTAYDFKVNGLCYNRLSYSTVELTWEDVNTPYTGDIVVPSYINYNGTKYDVVKIGDHAMVCVTSVGNFNWGPNRGLLSISLPPTIRTIGRLAFHGCSSLTSLSIPNSVTSISDGAFYGCSGLTSMSIPNSVTSIGSSAFYDCSGLTSLSIPNSVTSIGSNAFQGCSGLNDVISEINKPFEINKSVFSVYSTAKLTVPKGTKSAYQSTNYWNMFSNIVEAQYDANEGSRLPAGYIEVEYIQNDSYGINSEAPYINTNYIPNNNTRVKCDFQYTVGGTHRRLLGAGLYNQLNTYCIEAENSMSQSTPADIYLRYGYGTGWIKTGKKIDMNRHQIDFNKNLFYMDGELQYTCNNYTFTASYPMALFGFMTDTFCGGSTEWMNGRIYSCQIYDSGVLVRDFVPAKRNTDSKVGFYDVKNDVFYTSPNNKEFTAGPEVQNSSTKRTINVATAGLLSNYISESEKYNIEELTLTGELNGTDFRLLRDMAGNNYLGKVTNGKLKKLDMTNARIVAGGEDYLNTDKIQTSSVTLSFNNVVKYYSSDNTISQCLFAGCDIIENLLIPNSVTSIGDYAFLGCEGLSSIFIPINVTSFGYDVFSFCKGLNSIKVESGNTKYDSRNTCNAIVETSSNKLITGCITTIIPNSVTAIGESAFQGNVLLTSITIPSSVTSIGDYAFRYCQALLSITIPSSVTSIGGAAFEYCNSLKDVISKIKTPFVISDDVFSVYSTATLTVPKGTRSVYMSTNYWNKFNNIVEADDNSSETEVTFSSNGITYKGKNATLIGEVIAVGDNTKNMEIPSSVSYDGKTYSVTSIKNGALDGLSLNYLSIPSSITSLDNTTFSKCDLGALIWKANASLNSSVFSNAKFSTASNFLLYVNSSSYAPSNVNNVVVNNMAQTVILSDYGGNFYCPKEFTAQTISYTHNYSMLTGGNGKGWETLALPFNVQRIEHKTKGTLTPFAAYTGSSSQHPFWLYELGSNGFRRTSAILANTPYIIAMPNDSKYDDEYILAGDVTFSATNAYVYQTESLVKPSSNGKTFIPNFAVVNPSSSVYALNVNNNLASNYSSYDAGSIFINNLREIYPFEAYMTTSSSNVRCLTIGLEDGATGIDEIRQNNARSGVVKVYTLTGLLVFSVSQSEFDEKWNNLPSGVYIVNGHKMIKSGDAQYNIVQ